MANKKLTPEEQEVWDKLKQGVQPKSWLDQQFEIAREEFESWPSWKQYSMMSAIKYLNSRNKNETS